MAEELNFNGVDYPDMEKRESERLVKKLSARIKNQTCEVLNISKKGVRDVRESQDIDHRRRQ